MDVDIDLFGRHLDFEKRDRIAAREQQTAIRLAECMLERPIADRAAVQKQKLHLLIRPAVGRIGDVARDPQRPIAALDADQLPGQIGPEKGRDPNGPIVGRRQIMQQLVVMAEREMPLGISQRQPRESLGRMAEFGGRRPEELSPHGCIEEQVMHFDERPRRAAARSDRAELPTADFEFRAGGRVGGAAADHCAAHLGDRRQCLAAEAERADLKQIVGLANLARGMRGDGQRQLLGGDPAAVIDHADQLPPPGPRRRRSAPPRRRTAFSINSLTTLAGRSITSPAAILLTTLGDSWRISGIERGLQASLHLRELRDQIDRAAAVAPLVVVPAHDLEPYCRPITCVQSAAKIELCGSPMMSLDTIGSSV